MMRPLLFAASVMAVAASSDCPGQPRQLTAPCGIGFSCDSTATNVAAIVLGEFPTTLAVGRARCYRRWRWISSATRCRRP